MGYISDRFQKIKPFLTIILILTIIVSALGYQLIPTPLTLSFFLVSLFIALFKVTSNLIETWVIQINDEVMAKFGLIRIFGSIGWAVGSFLIAGVIDRQGYQPIPIYIIVLGVVVLLFMVGLPDSEPAKESNPLKMRDVRLLFSDFEYRLAVIIFFVLFVVYALDSLTVIDKMVELASTNQQIGNRWSLQAMVEIPLMIVGFRFIQRYSAQRILGITAALIGIRYILYGLATTPDQMIWISLLQGITFPFLLLTQKVLVNEYAPAELRASGHMVMTAITSNIPIIIVPLINSMLHRYISYSWILILGGLLCFIPVLLIRLLERKTI